MLAISLLCGASIGCVLGLIGGGGSILATPMLLYLVGLSPHVAIGTGAISVAGNALMNVVGHARSGNVLWKPALLYAAAGIAGAVVGSSAGKALDGKRLVFLFAIAMIFIGILMLKPRSAKSLGLRELTGPVAARVGAVGAVTGCAAGFFGIGGGFLIVPGLIFATGMPTINAVGSSLVSVTAFGLVTAANYAVSDYVDWPVAAIFLVGGLFGGSAGRYAAGRLAGAKDALTKVFAGVVFAVAAFILWQSMPRG